MARGIPRPSILEVPDLFSLLDSPRNRFYNSSAPRLLAKIHRGPRKYRMSTLKIKISENFQQFVKIFLFYFCFSGKPINFWYYYRTFRTLKYKFNADFFLIFFSNFGGIFRIFGITHSSKFPEDPEE